MMDWTVSAKIRFCVADKYFSPLHFAQVVNEFDNWPSSIFLGTAADPHTWMIFPINFGILCTLPFLILEV